MDGLGDGDTGPDAVIQGETVLLRAERSGTGNGRVYWVSFTAMDARGESCSGAVMVGVPHRARRPPIDDGTRYDSTHAGGLVAHFPLDGSCVDVSGHNNGCSVVGATPTAGALGGSYMFDGVDDELLITAVPALQTVTAGPHSIAAWVSLGSIPAVPKFVVDAVSPELGDSLGDQRGLRFQSDTTPVFKWVTSGGPGCQWPGNGTAFCLWSSVALDLLQWHHLVGVYDGASGRIYVDGVLVGESASVGVPSVARIWKIGNVSGGGTGEGFFHGSIDDVRVYNRALSSDEVQRIFARRHD